jgi:hypothetical protein
MPLVSVTTKFGRPGLNLTGSLSWLKPSTYCAYETRLPKSLHISEERPHTNDPR